MSVEPNKPYTLTFGFKPHLSTVQQYRMLSALGQNHLIVLTALNKTGGTVLTMYPSATEAVTVTVGGTLFTVGTGAGKAKAIITKITPGSTLKG